MGMVMFSNLERYVGPRLSSRRHSSCQAR